MTIPPNFVNKVRLPIIMIGGPTASGKSSLALNLAQEFQSIIINGDSMQVYKELPILTASPNVEMLDAVPHALYNYVTATEKYSVARWLEDIQKIIDQARIKNLVPIIVGGTGFYLQALEKGIAFIPNVEPIIVETLRKRYEDEGLCNLYEELMQVDPDTATKLHPHDQQRIMRALSVYHASGKPLSFWRQQPTNHFHDSSLQFFKILVMPETSTLKINVEARFKKMVMQGAVEEIKNLMKNIVNLQLPIFFTLGVRELMFYLNNQYDLEEAINQGIRSTFQYIKRQNTWFRHQYNPDIIYKNDTTIEKIIHLLKNINV